MGQLVQLGPTRAWYLPARTRALRVAASNTSRTTLMPTAASWAWIADAIRTSSVRFDDNRWIVGFEMFAARRSLLASARSWRGHAIVLSNQAVAGERGVQSGIISPASTTFP